MPLDKYFKGKGESVMSEMQERYGKKKGKSIFYATANKHRMAPPKGKKGAHAQAAGLAEMKGE